MNNNITAEEITVSRTIGKSAVIGHMERQYPVRKRAMLSMFGGDYWNSIQYFILAPHNVRYVEYDEDAVQNDAVKKMPVVKDNRYHRIKSDGNYILIELR